MPLICENCGVENKARSLFCKGCGNKLIHKSIKKSDPIRKLPNFSENEIEDILFIPQKKRDYLRSFINFLAWFVAILCVIGFLAYFLLPEEFEGGTYTELDSTYEEQEEYIPDNQNNRYFPIFNLELTKIDSEWKGEQFYLTGTIRNSYYEPAKNIKIRVDFSTDEAGLKVFDTRYITLDGVSKNGAYTFREPVFINNPEGKFWFVAQIESAENL